MLWERSFPTGTDSLAITPDGRTVYLPIGERTNDDVWYVVDARTGLVRSEIHAGPGPHNTIVSPDGRRVYLGPRNSRYLDVVSTRTNRLIRRIGPLLPGVRPFTINGRQTLAYTTATGFLGFQVSSIRTGRVLYTVPIRGFRQGRSLGTPSHGISLSPDSRKLYVIDVPNSYVHVFDISGCRAGRRSTSPTFASNTEWSARSDPAAATVAAPAGCSPASTVATSTSAILAT